MTELTLTPAYSGPPTFNGLPVHGVDGKRLHSFVAGVRYEVMSRVSVEGRGDIAIMRADGEPTIKPGDRLTIDGVDYIAREIERARGSTGLFRDVGVVLRKA